MYVARDNARSSHSLATSPPSQNVLLPSSDRQASSFFPGGGYHPYGDVSFGSFDLGSATPTGQQQAGQPSPAQYSSFPFLPSNGMTDPAGANNWQYDSVHNAVSSGIFQQPHQHHHQHQQQHQQLHHQQSGVTSMGSRSRNSNSGDFSREFSNLSLQSLQSDAAGSISSCSVGPSGGTNSVGEVSKLLSSVWAGGNGSQQPHPSAPSSLSSSSNSSHKSRLTASAPEFIPGGGARGNHLSGSTTKSFAPSTSEASPYDFAAGLSKSPSSYSTPFSQLSGFEQLRHTQQQQYQPQNATRTDPNSQYDYNIFGKYSQTSVLISFMNFLTHVFILRRSAAPPAGTEHGIFTNSIFGPTSSATTSSTQSGGYSMPFPAPPTLSFPPSNQGLVPMDGLPWLSAHPLANTVPNSGDEGGAGSRRNSIGNNSSSNSNHRLHSSSIHSYGSQHSSQGDLTHLTLSSTSMTASAAPDMIDYTIAPADSTTTQSLNNSNNGNNGLLFMPAHSLESPIFGPAPGSYSSHHSQSRSRSKSGSGDITSQLQDPLMTNDLLPLSTSSFASMFGGVAAEGVPLSSVSATLQQQQQQPVQHNFSFDI